MGSSDSIPFPFSLLRVGVGVGSPFNPHFTRLLTSVTRESGRSALIRYAETFGGV